MVHMEAWLDKVDEISAEGPSYKLGHDGSDGTCDCIGLIIGALNRCGVRWPGIHGSNWAARNAMAWLLPVSDAGDLAVGDIVFKGKRPGESGYALPDRYASDPDRNDYYHVGVVRSISPLRIIHCTSPGGVTTDTKVGKWSYRGGLALLDRSACEESSAAVVPGTAMVTASSGSTVNLRPGASKSGKVLMKVPVGSEVTVLEVNGSWAKVEVPLTGYIMTDFLKMKE